MEYDKNNIFAKIIRGEIPCSKIFEDDIALAFNDITPAAPAHILIIPKGEFCSFNDFISKADPAFIAEFFKRVQLVATKLGLDTSGYRLITNHGPDALQSVPHFHIHILGKKPLGPLIVGDATHS